MRVALIADIHANLQALRAVLTAIDARDRVDRIVCAGDTVGRGPDPNGVLEVLQERKIEVVLGNYDDAVAHDRLSSGVDFPDQRAMEVDQQSISWTRQCLSQQNLTYLGSLPRDVRLFPQPFGVAVRRDDLRRSKHEEGRSYVLQGMLGPLYRKRPSSGVRRVLVVHGSPRALNERVTEDTANSLLATIARVANTDMLISAHAASGYKRATSDTTFIGVGPLSGPHAEPGVAQYTLLDLEDQAEAEFHSVSYNVAEHADALAASGLPSQLVEPFRA